jgi:hypothetical protein
MIGFAAIVSYVSNHRASAPPPANLPAHGPEVPGVSQACLQAIQQAANTNSPSAVSPGCM